MTLPATAPPTYDLIIEHGRVVDGTGAPWFVADVGVRAGRVAAIGRLDKATAKQRIDAGGRVVAPGFIDMLGQSELTLLVNPHVPSKIFQGITTEITGEGQSVAPVNAAIAQEDAPHFRHYGITQDWTDFAGYFGRLEKQGVGINIGTYVAQERGTDPKDTLFDILVEDGAQTSVAVFAMSESDVALAAVQPWVSFCNDSEGTAPDGLLGSEFPHPRAYGTFPRVLRKYVREERRMSLEEAIRKFTSLPASRVRLNDRGVLKVGVWADIVVFDPEQITDKATFSAPKQLSVGMQWVLINGVPVIADGFATNALPGRVLRGQAYQAMH
jgi:N-acyl-D-aspartate/D-glutamate deacylase